MTKYIPPIINSTSFNCPHCHVLTTQFWYKAYSRKITSDGKNSTPHFPSEEVELSIRADSGLKDEVKAKLLEWISNLRSGIPFLSTESEPINIRLAVENVFVSECYDCGNLAIWLHDRLIYPSATSTQPPNQDMPPHISSDYEEARRIVNDSPRGAAALLRLCIQKVCVELGEKGRHLDTDIANLVAKGLDKRIQQALDIVRVIGNNSVHPGELDLKDDRETAIELFGLVNIIVETMISVPKRTQELYDRLPHGAREGIEKRDKKD